MCDALTEPPRPGSDLFTYWREQPFPEVDEERDLTWGDWTLRVRITKVKDSRYVQPPCKHVSMTVIG